MEVTEALLESAEELYEAAPCGYLSTRPDGTFLRVNQTFLNWTSYTRETLVQAKRLQDLLTFGSKVYYDTHVEPLLRMQGAVREIQLELRCKDGRTLPVLLNTVQKCDEKGRPLLLRSTLFDITDRQRYERELRLARQVAEERARQTAVGAALGQVLTRKLEATAQLQLCAEAIVEHLDVAEVRIWCATAGQEGLRLAAAAGVLSLGFDPRPERLPLREATAVQTRAAVLINEAAGLVPEPGEDWLRREGIGAALVLPLITGDRLLGAMAVYAREPLDSERQRALHACAAELAIGMERSWAERERDALLYKTREQAEALRASRTLLETTLRSIGDAVISTDARTHISFMNPVAESLTGWQAQDALGRPLRDVLVLRSEATLGPVESPVDLALQQGATVGLTEPTLLIRRDGAELAIDDSAAPIRADSGEAIGAVLVFRDVSGQRKAERELRVAQHRLSTVVRNAPVILFALDMEGRIILSEGRGLAALGIDAASRPGISAFEAYAEEPWLLAEFRRALAGESFVGGGELRGISFETHYTPTFNEDGTPSGTVGLALDVTERRRHEETIRKSVEFEQQLIGIVSHDLRNPISAILLSASLLLRRADALDDHALRTANRIRTSAERAMRLIRDLLDFTQARLGGGIPIQRAPVDLASVARQALDEIETGNPDRSLVLEQQGDLYGEWDADRLAQVFTNLCVNALKYGAPNTAVRVTLRDEGATVRLAVHNEGPPIPPESLGQIFLPMRRATARTDGAGRSVGLGLFIVNQIVLAHGGTIDVQSGSDVGTTFSVRLPRHPAQPPSATTQGV